MASRGVSFHIGDATDPVGPAPRIIAHGCNDLGLWGRGFVLAVSARWPRARDEYLRWSSRGSGFELGAVQFVEVSQGTTVANMVTQQGIRSARGVPPIRYGALRQALNTVADAALAAGASVHMPRVGCGLAGGTWDQVGPLVDAELCARGVLVVVYDIAEVGSAGAAGSSVGAV